jgi:diguanylate cyclase (GGDEF)-like protein
MSGTRPAGSSGRARTLARHTVIAVGVVGLCLCVATAIAVMERAKAINERSLRFGREAEAVQQAMIARVEDLTRRFESVQTFVAVTHPIPLDHYYEYMDRELLSRYDLDPGVMILEEIDVDQVEALEEREHALANTTFAVQALELGAGDGELLVITRAARVAGGRPFPFIGTDTSLVRPLLLPPDLPDEGYAVRVVESSLLSAFIDRLTEAEAETAAELGAEGGVAAKPAYSSYFAGRVESIDGEPIGWALQLLDARIVTDHVAVPDDINVWISVAGVDAPIAAVPDDPGTALADAELVERRSFATASQSWDVHVWADAGYGAETGLFADGTFWAVSLSVSSVIGLISGAWVHYRHRLVGASFELEHARSLATTDPLTGLLNRQGLIDSVRLLPPDRPATLFFVDLDGFKAVNDMRGHQEGDRVLVAVAQALRSSFRHDDLVSRLGGDEFVVFALDDLGPGSVDPLARRVVDEVAGVDPGISCSLGIASRPAGAAVDIKDLLRRADEAMYQAKRAGGHDYVLSPR